MSRTIDGKGHAHFLTAVFVIVAVSCAPKASMVGKWPEGTIRKWPGDPRLRRQSRLHGGQLIYPELRRDELDVSSARQSPGYQLAGCPGSGHAGDVVAQVMNIGNATFTDGGFTLAPNQVAYIWVGEVRFEGAPTRGYGVYTLSNTGYIAGEWSVAPLSKIQFCSNTANRRKPSIKANHPGPDNCAPIALAPTKTNRLASLGVSAAFAAPATSASSAVAAIGGLWISCAGGCCKLSPN